MLQDNKDRFAEALKADLDKPLLESLVGEIGCNVERSVLSAQKLDEWSQVVYPTVSEFHGLFKPTLSKVPKGVVLIIGRVCCRVMPYSWQGLTSASCIVVSP